MIEPRPELSACPYYINYFQYSQFKGHISEMQIQCEKLSMKLMFKLYAH